MAEFGEMGVLVASASVIKHKELSDGVEVVEITD